MLGAETFIHVAFCFFPRKDNDLPAFVGKSLEHYASFVMLSPRDGVDKTREIACEVMLISLGVARIHVKPGSGQSRLLPVDKFLLPAYPTGRLLSSFLLI